jgi:hypothetical protein
LRWMVLGLRCIEHGWGSGVGKWKRRCENVRGRTT